MNIEDVHTEWRKTNGPSQLKEISDYFGVYYDLFEDGYFLPVLPLNIEYPQKTDTDTVSPVYHGNLLKPSEVCPFVLFSKLSFERRNDKNH